GKVCGDIQKESARDRGGGWAESWVELYPCGTGPIVRSGEGTPYRQYSSPTGFQAVMGTAQARIDGNSARTYSWGGYGGYYYHSNYFNDNRCTGTGYICMGNANAGMLFPVTAPALMPTESNDSFRSASIDAGRREYDPASRTMTLFDFRATLRNNPYDKVNEFSALHLSVLRSADNVRDSLNYNNDDAYRESLLASSRVMLNNGNLLIDGALQKAHVETKDSVGYQIVVITMPEVRLQISQEINPDEVTLSMGSDVGLLTDGVSVRYLPGEERTVLQVASPSAPSEVLEFSSYPNPAARATTVDAMVTQTQPVTIGIYRADNTLVLPVYSGTLPARSRRSFPLNLNGLAPGTYYLRLERSGSRLTRRMVIQ
ncbi:MAG: T9SS type A sorting domain-containing protein, partial [Bacteroidota bacterium]|nr:T9SS type A sorting domain-containing protein [Bacteroidota bacterium]